MTNGEVVKTATGRCELNDALAWIAEGHALKPTVTVQRLLEALVGLDERDEHLRAALRRVARLAVESSLDTGSAIFSPDLLGPLTSYKQVLDLLAWKSSTHSLDGLTAEALSAAQRENPLAIEVFCTIAGLSC